MEQLTALLERVHAGDSAAGDALFAAAYAQLHSLARARLSASGKRAILDTTSLVHESYLRFVSAGSLRPDDRRSFFAYASQVMRSVIIDMIRERRAEKRGGHDQSVTLSTELVSNIAGDEQTVLQVHEALMVLERADPRLAEVAQMRYFGGYSVEEIAAAQGVSPRTVQRDWEKARLILAAALR